MVTAVILAPGTQVLRTDTRGAVAPGSAAAFAAVFEDTGPERPTTETRQRDDLRDTGPSDGAIPRDTAPLHVPVPETARTDVPVAQSLPPPTDGVPERSAAAGSTEPADRKAVSPSAPGASVPSLLPGAAAQSSVQPPAEDRSGSAARRGGPMVAEPGAPASIQPETRAVVTGAPTLAPGSPVAHGVVRASSGSAAPEGGAGPAEAAGSESGASAGLTDAAWRGSSVSRPGASAPGTAAQAAPSKGDPQPKLPDPAGVAPVRSDPDHVVIASAAQVNDVVPAVLTIADTASDMGRTAARDAIADRSADAATAEQRAKMAVPAPVPGTDARPGLMQGPAAPLSAVPSRSAPLTRSVPDGGAEASIRGLSSDPAAALVPDGSVSRDTAHADQTGAAAISRATVLPSVQESGAVASPPGTTAAMQQPGSDAATDLAGSSSEPGLPASLPDPVRPLVSGSEPVRLLQGMPSFWAAREAEDRAAPRGEGATSVVATGSIATASAAPAAQTAILLQTAVPPAAAGADPLAASEMVMRDTEAPTSQALAGPGPTGGPGTVPGSAPSAPPALPPTLPAQIAAAFAARTERPVELRMMTEELGALHLSLRQDGDQVRVALQADRGDTLDLLRRNGDLLIEELRAAGFSGATLSFGDGGDARDRAMPETAATDADRPVPERAVPDAAVLRPTLQSAALSVAAGAGLDLRF